MFTKNIPQPKRSLIIFYRFYRDPSNRESHLTDVAEMRATPSSCHDSLVAGVCARDVTTLPGSQFSGINDVINKNGPLNNWLGPNS